MKSFLTNIIAILITINCYSQVITGRLSSCNTGSQLSQLSVYINGSDFQTETDSLGKFVLSFNCNYDTVLLIVHYSSCIWYTLDYLSFVIRDIPVEDSIKLGEIKLIELPAILKPVYKDMSEKEINQFERRAKRNYKKLVRNFNYQDMWIQYSNGGYWMKKIDTRYNYEIEYSDFKKTITNKK
ncbi:hypothetical protein ACFLQ5_02255 [Bacteroidota bacterium]